jgi:2-hydroxy-6-oxonona-2,4-dienedioate hydrolase
LVLAPRCPTEVCGWTRTDVGANVKEVALDSLDDVRRLDRAAERAEVNVAGAAYVWRSWGEGPPIVLVHGAAGSWTHWVRNIDSLAVDHRVLAPDLLGFGDSELPDGVVTAEQLADGTVTAIDSLLGKTTRIDIVGFSFGGIVSGLLGTRLGTRVRRLCLIGAGGIGMSARVPGLTTGADQATDPNELDRAQLARFMFADLASADDTALAINQRNVQRTRFKSGSIPASTLLLDALPSITAEVHALYSDRDAFGGNDIADKFRRLTAVRADIHTHSITGAGHWSPYEAHEQVNAILTDALR